VVERYGGSGGGIPSGWSDDLSRLQLDLGVGGILIDVQVAELMSAVVVLSLGGEEHGFYAPFLC